MAMTQKHKAYAAAVAVAGAALFVDRVLLSEGAPAAADAGALAVDAVEGSALESTAAAATPASNSASAPASAAPAPPASAVWLARRLERLAAREGTAIEWVPDAFAAPASWSPAAAAAPAESPATATPDFAHGFIARHRLNAVLRSHGRSYVVVDGSTFTIGQELDGFRLVEVRQRAAVWERDGQRAQLVLSGSR